MLDLDSFFDIYRHTTFTTSQFRCRVERTYMFGVTICDKFEWNHVRTLYEENNWFPFQSLSKFNLIEHLPFDDKKQVYRSLHVPKLHTWHHRYVSMIMSTTVTVKTTFYKKAKQIECVEIELIEFSSISTHKEVEKNRRDDMLAICLVSFR